MIKLMYEFVTPDISDQLKDIGFGDSNFNNLQCCNDKYGDYYAPTWQEATSWLRNVHNIHIVIDVDINIWSFELVMGDMYDKRANSVSGFTSYEAAREIAIHQSIQYVKIRMATDC